MQEPQCKAAIDIGTNSIHLVVARLADHGGFEMLTTEKEMVRLGQGGGEMKSLDPDAIERAIRSLGRMRQVAGSFGDVEIAAVATSAVREARNRDDFLRRAREEVGVAVEVISGFEEARLIHLGVLQALPVFDRRSLVIDIGGGSTEFCVGTGGRVMEARSMKLGAIRLTQRFFPGLADPDHDGTVGRKAVKECRRYVRSALAPVAHELRGHQPEITIGSSGTATTTAAMAAARRGDKPHQLNGTTFTADELRAIVDDLIAAGTEQRLDMAGLDAKRVDIIVAGALLLHEALRAFSIDEMVISEYALREGVLFDRFGGDARRELGGLRRNNVERLCRQLDPDPDHAEHTARLATELFDRTASLHGYGEHERELLESAALVHNVGLFISHASHHKHTYYVVRNSEQMTGFTDHEVELIAVIARFHRKSLPGDKHPEFAALDRDDQRLVRILAGLLRLAIGLDRRHAAAVRSVRVYVDDGVVRIEPVAAPDADLDVEIYAARERSPLLAQGLGVKVAVERPAAAAGEHLST